MIKKSGKSKIFVISKLNWRGAYASFKNKFINLSIGKRMNLAFIYVGVISTIIILVALINMKSIEAKINDFYTGPYAIEENVLKAQVSMVKIENNINKAYMTKLEDLCKKYIEESEKDYGVLEESVLNLRKVMTTLNTNLENITKLEGERK
jgi:phosphoglycerate-specific signal transduction histidine kinase